MDKIATQIIDFYDDLEGAVLKKHFPTPEDLPEVVKQAKLLSEDERSRLREPLFALVLKNHEGSFKKYACTDKANTLLSAIYLLDQGQKVLPEEAVKVAAYNIASACEQFGMAVPEPLQKLASNEAPESPILDVTDLNKKEPEKEACYHCIESEKKYPIDSFDELEKAAEFFENHYKSIHPEKRREYCLNLTKRAQELEVSVPKRIKKYASDDYVDNLELRQQLAARMEKTADKKQAQLYSTLFEKRASMPAGVFAHVLSEIDQQTKVAEYWDSVVPDPFDTVLTLKKEAGYSYNSSQGYIDEEMLKKLAPNRELLKKAFGDDFADTFQKRPVEVFKSLPEPEKTTIMRLSSAVTSP